MSGTVPLRLLVAQSKASSAALAISTVIVSGAVFLTAAVPVLGADAATKQVQQDVAAAGHAADIVVSVPLGSEEGHYYELVPDTAHTAAYVGEQVELGMPPELRAVLGDQITTMLSVELEMGAVDGLPARLRFAYVAQGDGPKVNWVKGRAPASTWTALDFAQQQVKLPIEVGLTQEVADAVSVTVGDRLPAVDPDEGPLTVSVTGIYEPQTPGDPGFSTVPTLLAPSVTYGSVPQIAIAGLVTADALPAARLGAFPQPMARTYTYLVNASALTAENAKEVATSATGLASGKEAFTVIGAAPTVTTRLDLVINESLARTSSAQTNASVLLLALILLVAITQFLAASVLIERRSRVLGLLRTRGGSGPSVGIALGVEAAIVTALGVAVGLWAQHLVAPGEVAWCWVLPSILVSLLAAPLLGVRGAMRRRVPPPARSKRRKALSGAQLRRLTAEIVVVLAAAVSVLALRSRGTAQSQGSLAADALVLAAPALGAVAVGLMLARLMPVLGRWLQGAAARLRAPEPLIAASFLRATVAPTLALVLAGSIVALAASTATTVTRGLDDAAWDVVGADAVAVAQLTTGLPAGSAELATPDVTTASAADLGVGYLSGGTKAQAVTVVAVDAAALAELEKLVPNGVPGPWQKLADAEPGPDGALPMLQSADLQDVRAGILTWSRSALPVASIGLAPDLPGEAISGERVVVVDSADLAAAAKIEVPPTTVWAMGTGVGEALSQAVTGAEVTVTTREGWRGAVLGAPVTRALASLIVGAVVVSFVAATLGLLLVVAAGAGERRIATGRLRVVGFSTASVGRVARAHETAPVVIAGVVGVLTGLLLTRLLADALELSAVTSQPKAPPLVLAWWTLLLPVVLGVFAWVAVGVGARFGRTVKLGDVMRAN